MVWAPQIAYVARSFWEALKAHFRRISFWISWRPRLGWTWGYV